MTERQLVKAVNAAVSQDSFIHALPGIRQTNIPEWRAPPPSPPPPPHHHPASTVRLSEVRVATSFPKGRWARNYFLTNYRSQCYRWLSAERRAAHYSLLR